MTSINVDDQYWPWTVILLLKTAGVCEECGMIQHKTRKGAKELAEAWIGSHDSRTAWLRKERTSVAIKRGQKPWRKDD